MHNWLGLSGNIWQNLEPEPKINNFGSATLVYWQFHTDYWYHIWGLESFLHCAPKLLMNLVKNVHIHYTPGKIYKRISIFLPIIYWNNCIIYVFKNVYGYDIGSFRSIKYKTVIENNLRGRKNKKQFGRISVTENVRDSFLQERRWLFPGLQHFDLHTALGGPNFWVPSRLEHTGKWVDTHAV